MFQFKNAFQIPEDYQFVQVVDVFFKTHKVLNLEFEPVLAHMMTFLQAAIYKLTDTKKFTMGMKEVLNAITQ